jgi:3-methyl-2-oxobutanoate hydroxymethyltransferase
VMADMPFMSYQANEDQALHNAARFMTEGMADCVKVEVDRSWAPLVSRMSRAGIPVVAHIGCRPQQSKMHGGTFAVGKTAEQALQVIHDAAALEAAGATMLLLEACPSDVAAKVVERATIPVIGCGAGPNCHGQVLVLQDLLGMSAWQPSFARPEVQLGEATRDAAAAWCERVRQGHVESAFRMADGEGARLEALLTGAAHAKA